MDEVKLYQPIIDALTAHIAVLDADGVIIGVNKQWSNFCNQNGGACATYYIGVNYLELLDSIICSVDSSSKQHEDIEFASKIRQAIYDILAGNIEKFQIEYPCDSDSEARWFLLTISKCPDGGIIKAIVSHEDITALKTAENNSRLHLEQLVGSFHSTIKAISLFVEKRDPYTAGHQHSVSELSNLIALEMGLPKEMVYSIGLGAMVHDIGKIIVPAEILVKPGTLSSPEYQMIRVHPEAGYEILKEIDFPWPIAEMVYQHHERLDGSGYPRGLKGDSIFLEARVISVADVFDAITSHRPYRPAQGFEKGISELTRGSGSIYDSDVVDALIRILEKQKGV